MSDGKKRTVHSVECKAKVGMEAVRGVKTLNEIGQQYGVHPVVVGQWKKERIERAATLFDRKRGPQPAAYADEERRYGEIKNYDGLVVKVEIKGKEIIQEDENVMTLESVSGENWHAFVMHCVDRNLGRS